MVHGDLPRQHPFGTNLRFADPVAYGPDKLGTGPMVYGGLNIEMDAAIEIGRNPVSKHQIQPEYGDEQADSGRDCRIRLARLDSQARTETGKHSFSLSSRPRAGLATLSYPVDSYSAICVALHTHSRTLRPIGRK